MATSDIPIEYDAAVIHQQADLLYGEANSAVITSTIAIGVLGVLAAVASFNFVADRSEVLAIIVAVGIPIGAALLGAWLGSSRAFRLRSQAQQLLVLVAIERNTRKPPAVAQTHPAPSPVQVAS